MGWIEPKDKMPPEGLQVLLELSGRGIDEHGVHIVADHDFYLGTWILPVGEEEGHWLIENNNELWGVTVFAWMPLPKPPLKKTWQGGQDGRRTEAVYQAGANPA